MTATASPSTSSVNVTRPPASTESACSRADLSDEAVNPGTARQYRSSSITEVFAHTAGADKHVQSGIELKVQSVQEAFVHLESTDVQRGVLLSDLRASGFRDSLDPAS